VTTILTDMRAWLADSYRFLGFNIGDWALLLGATAVVIAASVMLM
jgi:hypothetical protein